MTRGRVWLLGSPWVTPCVEVSPPPPGTPASGCHPQAGGRQGCCIALSRGAAGWLLSLTEHARPESQSCFLGHGHSSSRGVQGAPSFLSSADCPLSSCHCLQEPVSQVREKATLMTYKPRPGAPATAMLGWGVGGLAMWQFGVFSEVTEAGLHVRACP